MRWEQKAMGQKVNEHALSCDNKTGINIDSEIDLSIDEFNMSAQIIKRQAKNLQRIAQDNNHDFLAYILKIVVLESETILGERGLD